MLGPEKVGFFVRQHRDELTRIWRMARAEARPEVFPGLLDDVVGSFFETCADLLSRGAAPEEVWAGVAGLVGRTVADVERDLIIDTLKHTLGNRTHAARILGISIRTLRNKLNEYVAEGTPVPPPGGGEMRGAA